MLQALLHFLTLKYAGDSGHRQKRRVLLYHVAAGNAFLCTAFFLIRDRLTEALIEDNEDKVSDSTVDLDRAVFA